MAGHRGLVGSAVVNALAKTDRYEIVTADRSNLDLREGDAVRQFLLDTRPDGVIVAAGTVGGIRSNSTRPAEFLWDNVMIIANLVESARLAGVGRLLYLSSNCVYPKEAIPPHKIEMIGQSRMEETNEWYGYAKIAGMKLCESYRKQYGCDFFSVIPTSCFGPGDSTSLGDGHVISDVIMKCLSASAGKSEDRTLNFWGTGSPIREYLFTDDLADALVLLFEKYEGVEPVNVGGGTRISIRDLVFKVASMIDSRLSLQFDNKMTDGAPARYLDNAVLESMGWAPKNDLDSALRKTIDWYRLQEF